MTGATAVAWPEHHVLVHADRWSLAAVAYACGVGAFGLAGDITGNPHFWLAAFLCTLPLGIPAFVGMYLGSRGQRLRRLRAQG